jgi:integrase
MDDHGPSSAQHVRTALRTAYNFVIRKGRTLQFNPVQASEPIVHRARPVEVLTREAYHAILEDMKGAGDAVLEALVVFTLDTCCRPSEVLAATGNRIDWERKTVLIDRIFISPGCNDVLV